MNVFEQIKDTEQKERLIFNESKETEAKTIGNTLEDFEIISLIGQKNSKKFKVLSKINNKIYAMNVIKINKIKKNDEYSLLRTLNEIKYLNILSHPNIVKYYKYFIKDENLYIIMEYMPNQDLYTLIDERKRLNKPFKEEEIWNLFLQSSNALYYMHKKGFIHRDIRLKNILFDKDMKVKLGNFGFITGTAPDESCYDKYSDGTYVLDLYDVMNCNLSIIKKKGKIPEEIIDENKSDQKIDVYALGKVFFEIVYFHSPLKKKENDKNISYSNKDKIDEIINLMLERDKNKRESSLEILKKVGIEYSRICRNYSVHSMIMCLSSLIEFNKLLINESNKYEDCIDKPILQSYTNFMKYLYNENSNFNLNIFEFKVNDFRKKLGLENIKLQGTKEIDPSFLFSFILAKLHEETKNDEYNNRDYKNGPYPINNLKEDYKTNEIEARNKFDNSNKDMDSPIIKYFRGLIKQTNICKNCFNKTYKFTNYFFLNFNFDKIIIMKNSIYIDLEDIFKMNNNFYDIMYCNNCIAKKEHICEKEYYSFPKILVINIFQIDNSKKKEIYIKENLELKASDKEQKYKLVGVIRQNKDKQNKGYFSYFYFDQSNQWFKGERYKKFVHIESPEGKKIKDLVMLFYILI